MSPLQKHAKLIRFSRPASRLSLLLSAQGRGRRSGSFWEPRSTFLSCNSDILTSYLSSRVFSAAVSALRIGCERTVGVNIHPLETFRLNCNGFSSFNPTMTSRQGFHDRSTTDAPHAHTSQTPQQLNRWPPSTATFIFLADIFQCADSHKAEANTLKHRVP